MNELAPVHWDRLTLGEVTKWKSGGTPSKSNPEYWGGDIPWISAKSMKNFFLFDSEDRVTKKAVANGARLVEPGDILMLVRGMTLNNDVPICVATRQMAFNQDVKSIRGVNGTDSRFIAYWLLANKASLLSLVDQASHGTGRFRMDVLLSMKMQLPPLPEQRAIASVLGSLDDKIELNRRTNRTLEDMAAAIFKAWFVDFEPVRAKASGADAFAGMPQDVFDALPATFTDSELGPIPEGWEVKPLPDIIEVNPKRSLKKGELAPHFEMKNMPTQGHAPEAWGERPFGSGMKFINGDTLVARITPCLENGKTAFVDFLDDGTVGWGSTEYIVLRPKPPLPEVFAYCLARTDDFRDFAIQNMTGTSGRQRVPATALDHYPLVQADETTARCFGEIVDPLFTMIRSNMDVSHTLSKTRDTLLPKLLSGEVRVRYTEMEGATI